MEKFIGIQGITSIPEAKMGLDLVSISKKYLFGIEVLIDSKTLNKIRIDLSHEHPLVQKIKNVFIPNLKAFNTIKYRRTGGPDAELFFELKSLEKISLYTQALHLKGWQNTSILQHYFYEMGKPIIMELGNKDLSLIDYNAHLIAVRIDNDYIPLIDYIFINLDGLPPKYPVISLLQEIEKRVRTMIINNIVSEIGIGVIGTFDPDNLNILKPIAAKVKNLSIITKPDKLRMSDSSEELSLKSMKNFISESLKILEA